MRNPSCCDISCSVLKEVHFTFCHHRKRAHLKMETHSFWWTPTYQSPGQNFRWRIALPPVNASQKAIFSTSTFTGMTFTPHSCINLWRSQISQSISISLGTLQWTHHRRECYTDHPSQEIKHEIYDYPWGAIYLISKRIQLWGIGYTRVLCIHKLFFTSAGQPSNCRDTWKQVFLSTKNSPQETTGLLQHIWDVLYCTVQSTKMSHKTRALVWYMSSWADKRRHRARRTCQLQIHICDIQRSTGGSASSNENFLVQSGSL